MKDFDLEDPANKAAAAKVVHDKAKVSPHMTRGVTPVLLMVSMHDCRRLPLFQGIRRSVVLEGDQPSC